MDAVRLADSPPGPHKQPSSPAPWARLALVLGVLSLLVFWVAFYQILTHSDWYFLREWGLFIAFLLGLMSLAAHGMGQAVTSNGMAPPEHSDGTTPSGHSAMAALGAVVSLARHHSDKGNRGYGCLIGGFVGSVFLAGVIFMLVFGGSRTRAIEKFMNRNVAEVASMLAGTLDELKEASLTKNWVAQVHLRRYGGGQLPACSGCGPDPLEQTIHYRISEPLRLWACFPGWSPRASTRNHLFGHYPREEIPRAESGNSSHGCLQKARRVRGPLH